GNLTEWMYRNDAAVQVRQGETFSVWIQAAGAPSGGRAYFCFGASAAGTLSLVLEGNSSALALQDNTGFGFTELANVSQTWLASHWYRFEVTWGIGGSITGRVYDSDGTTLLNTVTATDTNITSGGIAFRGFGPTYYFDTVQIQTDEDWYSVAVNAGDPLLIQT